MYFQKLGVYQWSMSNTYNIHAWAEIRTPDGWPRRFIPLQNTLPFLGLFWPKLLEIVPEIVQSINDVKYTSISLTMNQLWKFQIKSNTYQRFRSVSLLVDFFFVQPDGNSTSKSRNRRLLEEMQDQFDVNKTSFRCSCVVWVLYY